MAIDSIIAGSSIISGGSVSRSVLGRGVRIHTGAEVEESVMFDNCDIGRHAKVRRAILDKNVKIPEGAEIGFNLEKDRKKYYVTDSGIVVIEGHQSTVDIATLQV
jgi:glucose-1-phosphate adenylyltransferase